MPSGITLRKFATLKSQGENIKPSKRLERLLNKPKVNKFKTKQLKDITFSDYVDLKRYFETEDYYNFCRIFAVKKWYQTIYVHHMDAILIEYKKQSDELIAEYYYVFDPPVYGEPGKQTIGSDLRNDFVQEFGNDVVIMDVIMRWENCSYKDIESWKLSEVLFWANYLIGQRIVENVE
jgi:hypothetical protein